MIDVLLVRGCLGKSRRPRRDYYIQHRYDNKRTMQPIIHAYTLFVTQHALFNITLYRKSIIKCCFLHKNPLDGTIHLGEAGIITNQPTQLPCRSEQK